MLSSSSCRVQSHAFTGGRATRQLGLLPAPGAKRLEHVIVPAAYQQREKHVNTNEIDQQLITQGSMLRQDMGRQQQHQAVTKDVQRDNQIAIATLTASAVGGLFLGLMGFGVEDSLPLWAQTPSNVLGWSYFLAWSFSFYPQVVENWRRKSVDGLSADYLVYSIIGYAAYAAYTASLYFSPGVQAAYMAAHGGSAPDVPLCDVLFAGHALVVTLFTLYQCYLYGGNRGSSSAQQQSSGLSTSRACEIITVGVVGAVAAYCGHVGTTCGVESCDAWLPLLYFLGTTKVIMTLIKYTPQALLNHKRRSTEGWQINNVLLDFAGGILSFAQIGLNAVARADPSVITGNPAKLGISAISIVFDIIFICQHYVLYRDSGVALTNRSGGATQPDVAGAQQSEPSSVSGGSKSSSTNVAGVRRLARRATAVAVNASKGTRGPQV